MSMEVQFSCNFPTHVSVRNSAQSEQKACRTAVITANDKVQIPRVGGVECKKRKRIITYMGGVMKMAQWNLNILQVYVRYSRGSSAVWTMLSKKREKEPWSFFIWEILENVTISSISQEKYCTSAGVKESWDLEKFASVYVQGMQSIQIQNIWDKGSLLLFNQHTRLGKLQFLSFVVPIKHKLFSITHLTT